MLSYSSALLYLKNSLHIDDAETKLKDNKLTLLNEMIRAQHQYIPYQNFTLIGTDVEKRVNPSLNDCIKQNLNLSGGVCVVLQGFFLKLLQCLGFKAYYVIGEVLISQIEDDHVVIIVTDLLSPGDQYYVDVGLCYPTLCAIPLHLLEGSNYDTYHFCFHTIRLARDGNRFLRSHKRRSSDSWDKFLYFDADKPVDFNYFDNSMRTVFTDEEISIFLKNCFASIYLPEKAITVKNLSIKIWYKENNTVEELNFDSAEKASEKVAELFPMLPLDSIAKGFIALKKWEQNQIQNPDSDTRIFF